MEVVDGQSVWIVRWLDVKVNKFVVGCHSCLFHYRRKHIYAHFEEQFIQDDCFYMLFLTNFADYGNDVVPDDWFDELTHELKDNQAPMILNPDYLGNISVNDHEIVHIVVDWFGVHCLVQLHIFCLSAILYNFDGVIDSKYGNFIILHVSLGYSNWRLINFWF